MRNYTESILWKNMAKVFLDTNILIDLVEERTNITTDTFGDHDIIISPLSVHILMYVLKKKVPFSKLITIINPFSIIEFNKKICNQAMLGPTNDFEDNVQLHSAAEEECSFFLTNDKKLLDMKFFGKVRIEASLI